MSFLVLGSTMSSAQILSDQREVGTFWFCQDVEFTCSTTNFWSYNVMYCSVLLFAHLTFTSLAFLKLSLLMTFWGKTSTVAHVSTIASILNQLMTKSILLFINYLPLPIVVMNAKGTLLHSSISFSVYTTMSFGTSMPAKAL